jgi:hypothetical protein
MENWRQTIKPIMTVDEIKDLSNQEIYQRILGALDFDDYKMAERKR